MTADGTPTPRTGDTITSVEALDALPVGLVLRTVRGYLTEIVLDDRGRRYVRATPDTGGDGGWYTHSERVLDMLPLTVLFRPDAPQPAVAGDAVERVLRAVEAAIREMLNRYRPIDVADEIAQPDSPFRAALAAAGAGEAAPVHTGRENCPTCFGDCRKAGEAADREALAQPTVTAEQVERRARQKADNLTSQGQDGDALYGPMVDALRADLRALGIEVEGGEQ